MKNILFIIIMLVLFSCSNKNQGQKNWTVKQPEVITGSTNISSEEDIHDFGLVNAGEIVIFKFYFKNTGDYNLLINKTFSDCSCVRTSFTKTHVNPNESGFIEIEFNSGGLFGKQFKSIEIDANTQESKHLAIFADVKNEQLEIKY